jgi:polysaccharide pyruvyl transferase WcaK-like protein
MYITLQNFGFKPILISLKTTINIYFLRKYLNIKEIRNYTTDLNQSDFNILVVNSDQVWNQYYDRLLEVGFLSFAEKWNISKFVYGASLANDYWNPSQEVINSARKLVKQFSGVSVREQGSVAIMKKQLGVEPNFVLDPTLLLDKHD